MPSPSRRLLALHLPQLPLDRFRRRDDARLWGPFAVTAKSTNAERVLCANDLAMSAGVRGGQSVTNAMAICPDLLCEPQDAYREARLLAALHVWADRFSPRVAIDPPDGMVLDVTGCAHLFGGEVALSELVIEQVEDLKVTARIGLANTRRAARGFARFSGEPILVTDPKRESEAVARLPVAALELEADVETDLRRLGVETIGQLARFKSSELARRFSVYLPTALEELRGHRMNPVVPSAAPRTFAARMSCPEEISLAPHVMAILERLAERLCRRLEDSGHAARGFALHLRCVDGARHELKVGFASPCRDAAPILRQFQRPVEGLRMAFGAEWFRLVALDAELFVPRQLQAGDAVEATRDAVDQTLTTLGNRLGFDRLTRPVMGTDHPPEREVGFAPVVDAQDRAHASHRAYPRPEIVFAPYSVFVEEAGHPPRAFRYHGDTYHLTHARGPERVAPFAWDTARDKFEARVRDYWRVRVEDRNSEPRLFWIMSFAHHPGEGWYLCGEFLREPRLELVRS